MNAVLPNWPHLPWCVTDRPGRGPRILGLNPWIHDFAAYNVRFRPLGLLTCLHMLRETGADVALLDCLEHTWADIPWPASRADGCGRFPKTPVELPRPLAESPRPFNRYGLPRPAVVDALKVLSPAPDMVLVTSLMTYWYPGALEMIRLARDLWPRTPVVLGGVYATLCRDHALANAEADLVISGPLEAPFNWAALWSLLGQSPPPLPPQAGFSPALDLYAAPTYSAILGSRGCPFSCPPCASKALYGSFSQRSAASVWADLEPEIARGVNRFAFFDDALLLLSQTWLAPLLKRLAKPEMQVHLHAPNPLHIRDLDPNICILLRRAGLTTARLGLESFSLPQRLEFKVSEMDWLLGVSHLLGAGFSPGDIDVSILVGLPDQDMGEVQAAMAQVRAMGLKPLLTYYSPVPGSELFARAKELAAYPLESEPLFQNNSLWTCFRDGFSWKEARHWRALARGLVPEP